MHQDPGQRSGEGPGAALAKRQLMPRNGEGVAGAAVTYGGPDEIELAKQAARRRDDEGDNARQGQPDAKPA